MARGPKPYPAGLRIAAGTNKDNPGRENPNTPDATGELGPPPGGYHLNKGAKTIWKRDAPHWPDEADRAQFSLYCIAMADAYALHKVCEKEGWFYETENGAKLRHPAAIQHDSCARFANRIANEFGMNPTSRNKVHAPPKPRFNPADIHFGKTNR